MPAAVDAQCRACGGRHTLCLQEGDFFLEGVTYGYVCPQTGVAARLESSELRQVVSMCPSWAIEVRPVDQADPPAV